MCPRVCQRSKQAIGPRKESQVRGASGAPSRSAPPAASTAPEASTPAARESKLLRVDATNQGKNSPSRPKTRILIFLIIHRPENGGKQCAGSDRRYRACEAAQVIFLLFRRYQFLNQNLDLLQRAPNDIARLCRRSLRPGKGGGRRPSGNRNATRVVRS